MSAAPFSRRGAAEPRAKTAIAGASPTSTAVDLNSLRDDAQSVLLLAARRRPGEQWPASLVSTRARASTCRQSRSPGSVFTIPFDYGIELRCAFRHRPLVSRVCSGAQFEAALEPILCWRESLTSSTASSRSTRARCGSTASLLRSRDARDLPLDRAARAADALVPGALNAARAAPMPGYCLLRRLTSPARAPRRGRARRRPARDQGRSLSLSLSLVL